MKASNSVVENVMVAGFWGVCGVGILLATWGIYMMFDASTSLTLASAPSSNLPETTRILIMTLDARFALWAFIRGAAFCASGILIIVVLAVLRKVIWSGASRPVYTGSEVVAKGVESAKVPAV